MKISPISAAAYEFACHSSACRPPTSGGTGGSSGTGSRAGRAAYKDHVNKTIAGIQPVIKGGAVHVDGKAITNKIHKVGGGYATTLRGAHQSITQIPGIGGNKVQREVFGKTKKELAQQAVEAHGLHLANKDPGVHVTNQGTQYHPTGNSLLSRLAAQKLTPEQNAKVQARADRAMGINKQPTLKQVADQRSKAPVMRDLKSYGN